MVRPRAAGPDILQHGGKPLFHQVRHLGGDEQSYPGVKLGSPEHQALNDVRDIESSFPINRKLRAGTELSSRQKQTVELVDRAIGRYSTQYDATVYRSARIPENEVERWVTPGSRVVEPGYMSTATSHQEAWEYHYGRGELVRLEISVPEGTPAMAGNVDWRNAYDGAGELVFGRGTALRIVSARREGTWWLVEAEMETSDGA